jgi:hypothetical protein
MSEHPIPFFRPRLTTSSSAPTRRGLVAEWLLRADVVGFIDEQVKRFAVQTVERLEEGDQELPGLALAE